MVELHGAPQCGMVCIIRIKHKALRRFWEADDRRGLPPEMVRRLSLRLDHLAEAAEVRDLDLPGYRLHALTGDLAGFWSIRVTDNWRLVFRFEAGEAVDVDLIDYH